MKIALILIAVLALASIGAAEETSFDDVKLPSAKGKFTKANLTFSDDSKAVVVRAGNGTTVSVAYDQIDDFSYEYSKKHRLRQGLAVGILTLSPGAGLIVALTKSRSHWLDVDYHEEDTAKIIVLQLDKRTYQQVCEAAKARTGKEVIMFGQTDVAPSGTGPGTDSRK